jgi:hypothetical protein
MDTKQYNPGDHEVAHINPAILALAKEMGAKVGLTGSSYRGNPSRNQALLNGRFIGFYPGEAFGGNGTEGWQLGSGRIKGSRAQAMHFVSTGEIPVDGVAAPRKAIKPASSEQTTQQQQATPSTDGVLARLELIKSLKAAGISEDLIALALKG